jgi:hypothetical protein
MHGLGSLSNEVLRVLRLLLDGVERLAHQLLQVVVMGCLSLERLIFDMLLGISSQSFEANSLHVYSVMYFGLRHVSLLLQLVSVVRFKFVEDLPLELKRLN